MPSNNPARPNILFILSDDQGAWAMRCAGNEEMVTPNLDRLSATGIRFDNFFCASPVCSPARASILTGRIPSQHGVQDFLRAGNAEFLPGDGLEIDYIAGQPTYIELLAQSGYECGLSGKWHIGKAALQRAGFSFWNVHAGGGGHYYAAPMIVNGERYQPRRICYRCHNRQRAGFPERAGRLGCALLAECALHRAARALGQRRAPARRVRRLPRQLRLRLAAG